MKDKIIETAGKTWRFLGQNGEYSVAKLSKDLKEKFAHYNSDTTHLPKLPMALAHLNTDRFIQKFFLSVPVSPPNS